MGTHGATAVRALLRWHTSHCSAHFTTSTVMPGHVKRERMARGLFFTPVWVVELTRQLTCGIRGGHITIDLAKEGHLLFCNHFSLSLQPFRHAFSHNIYILGILREFRRDFSCCQPILKTVL